MSDSRPKVFLSDDAVGRLRRAADTPETGGTPYTILEELGRGGMGTVYRALDAALDREVALKVSTLGEADPEEAERMRKEARVMARLEHPGIVPIHDAGVFPDGRVYYAMRLVRGERLDRWAKGRTLPERLVVFQKICDAVAFAHAHGVIHRDLKPENIMLGSFGEVLVLDWGVARRREEPAEPPGTVLGTRAYMAPEQARGRTDLVDERTDVYALGSILVFLLDAPGLPDKAPRAIRSVASRATQSDPSARYLDAHALSADIARYLNGTVPAAHRETLPEKLRRFGSRHRMAIFLVLTYLVVRTLLILFLGR
jgi:eukaryotic-like serine/threonine-protein kinase